jgi:hypothetical protein
MENLRFEGEVNVWLGAAMAMAAAGVIFWIYRRETGHRRFAPAILLPLLRAAVVAMIVLMLTGPVLRGSLSVADLSRVIVLVDGSKSMGLTDATMSRGRKWLVARRLGWVDDESVDTSLHDAAQSLALIRSTSERVGTEQTIESYRRRVDAALDALQADDPYRKQVTASLREPLDQIARDHSESIVTDTRLREDLESVRAAAETWVERLEDEYRKLAGESSPSDSSPEAATQQVDQWSRWRRAEAVLLRGDAALLPNLAGAYHVDLLQFSSDTSDSEPVALWQPLPSNEFPDSFDPLEPDGSTTDLATQLEMIVGNLPTTERLAVVMMSDGQHNYQQAGPVATSPLHLARLLGRRGVPLFPIGFGAASPPPDLAVLAVQTPDKVFADDRIKGDILIKDHMPEGRPYQLTIEIEGQTVWSAPQTTSGNSPRSVSFDFAIKDLVEDRLAEALQDVQAVSLPLPMVVNIEVIEGEIRDDNNSHETSVRAITRPRRALLIDGRPRWEFRYLRNMLVRDEHWDVNHVLATFSDGRYQMPHGRGEGRFPASQEELFGYDVIVLGEVPSSVFDDQEFRWLEQFVSAHGGGLVLVDGRRGKLRSYVDSPLQPLLPIRWTADHSSGLRDVSVTLTDRGRATSALDLGNAAGGSPLSWGQLPRLSWLAPVAVTPGCEALVDGHDGQRSGPALVMRRYGAGSVLYSAFDDSWRWRFEVADLVHQRYWNQIITFVMESPFAIHDRFVSIDTGGFTYQPGQTADLAVRLRDRLGQPVMNADAKALLYQDDALVGTVPLENVGHGGGILRGTTQPLDPGTYDVAVDAEGFGESMLNVRAEFVVVGNPTGELNVLSCNEELLREMAELSGGQYLREEDAGRLIDLLAPYADGKNEATEFVLWRSWYFFIPIVGLFTVEWLLRKRLGLM